MHRFIEYISDLLFLHDCVIIPDFGGFICNYTSAYIDENSGMICPPGKDILFNRNLTHNDGLLVNWIAQKDNLSYEKAERQLALFCEDLKIRLNQRQRVVFGDIGVFYTDRRFNIIFENGKNNFFAEALGMEPIPTATSEIHKSQPVQLNIPPDMSGNLYPYTSRNSSGNLLQRMLKYGLAVAVIAGIAVISQTTLFQKHADNGNKITNNTAIQPAIPTFTEEIAAEDYNTCNSVISPDHDYIDYDPLNDLRW